MGARSKARKRALDVLYSADLRSEELHTALERFETGESPPSNPYTAELVKGVAEHQARIDEVLDSYAADWTLARMPAVDRNVLRLATWELLYSTDIPEPVAVSEAVALVRDLSTDESPSFVNGVLGSIQRDKATLT